VREEGCYGQSVKKLSMKPACRIENAWQILCCLSASLRLSVVPRSEADHGVECDDESGVQVSFMSHWRIRGVLVSR
jgi:hypothetical protein